MKRELLYDYQQETLASMEKSDKGIICLPTGTGKTMIQAAFISSRIEKTGGFSIYVINAPRIMLSYQLLREAYKFLTLSGIEAKYCCVHSGGPTDIEDLEKIRISANTSLESPIPYSDILSGTSVSIISEAIKKASELDVPLIFFSTYNSAERIQEALDTTPYHIDTVVNDEAHYLVQERFHDVLHSLNAKRCYFFTATTIHTPSDNGRGMNNTESYGEMIYSMTPLEAIQRGKMVPPRIQFVISKSGHKYKKEDFDKSLGLIIRESFEHHRGRPDCLNSSKMLISAKGVGDIKKFMESSEYWGMINSGIKIYAIASDESIGNNINGIKVSRQKFLSELKKDGTDENLNLIVIHYDILAEGIDISGFTGIMPLRNLTKSKFLQTYGRAARLHPDDRLALEKSEITPMERNKFKKPYAWVIIPTILSEDLDNRENVASIIKELRSYGFLLSELMIVTEEVNGIGKTEGPEALIELKKKSKSMGLFIEEVDSIYESDKEAEIESERRNKLNSLKPEEKLRMVQQKLL